MMNVITEHYMNNGVVLSSLIPNTSTEEPITWSEKLNLKLLYNINDQDFNYICENPCIIEFLRNYWKFIKTFSSEIESSVLFMKIKDDSIDNFINRLSSNLKTMMNELLKETCAICLDKHNSSFFGPCGHGTCEDCSDKISKCHMCRTMIQNRYTKDDLKQENEDKTPDEKPDEKDAEEDSNEKKNLIKFQKPFQIIYDHTPFLAERIDILFSKKSGFLSDIQAEELYLLIQFFPDLFIELFKSAQIQNESIRCFSIAMLYNIHQNIDFLDKLSTPNRLMRFLNALGYNIEDDNGKSYADDKEKIIFKKQGSSRLKKVMLRIINKFPNTIDTEDQIVTKSEIWKRLIFHHIHPFVKKNIKKYPNCFQLANNLMNFKNLNGSKSTNNKLNKLVKPELIKPELIKKMSTILGTINLMIEDENIEIFEILLKYPGLSYRLMRLLAYKYQAYQEFKDFVSSIIPLMTKEQQTMIYYVFTNKSYNVVLNKHQKLRWNK